MSYVRPATHAGSWYTSDPLRLSNEIKTHIQKARTSSALPSDSSAGNYVPGARILIGPHAGYTYSAERLAETFAVWDTRKVKRVFILGPSHHIYFKNHAMLSRYEYYETPLGDLPVDTECVKELLASRRDKDNTKPVYKFMSEDADEDEHSFEMHAPFIYYRSQSLPQGVPKIVPIMISAMDDDLNRDVVKSLVPYLKNEENHFVISSDFCHWGSRFGYTMYIKDSSSNSVSEDNLIALTSSTTLSQPIYKSIETLDKQAMKLISSGSYKEWCKYIRITENTVCGQKPIGVVLRLLEILNSERSQPAIFNWTGYSQSGQVKSYYDSSVSYASGYVQV